MLKNRHRMKQVMYNITRLKRIKTQFFLEFFCVFSIRKISNRFCCCFFQFSASRQLIGQVINFLLSKLKITFLFTSILLFQQLELFFCKSIIFLMCVTWVNVTHVVSIRNVLIFFFCILRYLKKFHLLKFGANFLLSAMPVHTSYCFIYCLNFRIF